MDAAAAEKKKVGERIHIDWVEMFKATSDVGGGGGDACFDSTPPPAAGKGEAKGNAAARLSPDSGDVRVISPPSAPAKGKGKRRRADEGLVRDIEGMSDGELQREIAGICTFAGFLTPEKRERRERLLLLLQEEARHRGIRTGAAKDVDDRSRGAPSSAKDVYAFDSEDEQTGDAANKYCRNKSHIRPKKKNYGQLPVQTSRSSNQTGPGKPIPVHKMYSSNTSPTALRGHTMRVRAVHPKERDNEKSRQNENNYYRINAKRRKAHHEDSSLLPQKVNDVVLLDDEDVQPDEPVDCGVLDEWKDLKIYYPPSDDPEAVELSSSDIKCLNPGVYLSSPVINYYIQYIKRAEMRIEYGTDKFYMFNTYFYSKLQEALLDKGKFLKLRRWWKGVNIFQRGYIILPIHGTLHWSLIIVCMPAKDSSSGPIILHLDSLGMHPSAEIFDTVGRYLEEEWHHLGKNPHSVISISETIWEDLPRNIQKEKVEVPGQNNAYDCGIFMLYYIKRFIEQAPERFTRDSLDMLGRRWFRSEDTYGLRKKIRELLLELFGNARVDDVMSEATARDVLDEDCVIKEGESEAVTRCDSSGMVAGGGDTTTRNQEDFMEVRSLEGAPLTTCRSDGRIGDCSLSEAVMLSDGIDEDTMKTDFDSSKTEQGIEILPSDGSGIAVGGGDTSTRNEEDFIEVRSVEGTPLTTCRSDGRIVDCALSEAVMLSDNIDDDDPMETGSDSLKAEQGIEILSSDDGSGMDVGGGDTSTRKKQDFIELRPLEGTPWMTTGSSDGRTIACALSEATTFSDSIDDEDTMKAIRSRIQLNIADSDSTPEPSVYCSDSCDSDVEELKKPEVEKPRWRRNVCSIV